MPAQGLHNTLWMLLWTAWCLNHYPFQGKITMEVMSVSTLNSATLACTAVCMAWECMDIPSSGASLSTALECQLRDKEHSTVNRGMAAGTHVRWGTNTPAHNVLLITQLSPSQNNVQSPDIALYAYSNTSTWVATLLLCAGLSLKPVGVGGRGWRRGRGIAYSIYNIPCM